MYSEQLEQLIKSVIADGKITEKERVVLRKKAAAENVDEDEIDVYVDGLIAQMKTPAGSNAPAGNAEASPKVKIDFNQIEKIPYRSTFFYVGKISYFVENISDDHIQSIHLNFYKQIYINKDKKEEVEYGITTAFINKGKWYCYSNNKNLALKTDTNIIQLESWFGKKNELFPEALRPNNQYYSLYLYKLDEELLELLCNAKHITMSLRGCNVRCGDIEKSKDFLDIPVNGLQNYAKVFYRSVIDNTAYPDAEIVDSAGTGISEEVAAGIETAASTDVRKETTSKAQELFEKIENGDISIRNLINQINDIQLTDAEIESCKEIVEEKVGGEYKPVKDGRGQVVKKIDDEKLKKLKEQKKLNLIQIVPVPNTKEDILDFLDAVVPNAKRQGGLWGTVPGRIKILAGVAVVTSILCLIFGDDNGLLFGFMAVAFIVMYGGIACVVAGQDVIQYNKRADAWRIKVEQALMKGRSLSGDEEFTRKLDYYESLLNKK
jgi:hypothetical protein